MENFNSLLRVDKAEFRHELISCLDSGVVSNKMGKMIINLVTTSMNSRFFKVDSVEIREEAFSATVELVVKRICGGSRPSDDSKIFDYYMSIILNFLRKFLSRNVSGIERNVDLYGCSTSTNLIDADGKIIAAKTIPESNLNYTLLSKYINTKYEE